ncbi:MAG: T9SS type A sorting domain-containing protein [Chitinophagales bacterium]
MTNFYCTTLVFLVFTLNLKAQNEFYVDGDNLSATIEVYVDGNDGTNPTLFVAGEINNNQGVFQNIDGIVELTGNFTNTADETNAKYESTGVERFSGASNQIISGDLNGLASLNNLYNVKIDKASTTRIDLASNLNVKNSISFENDGGIIRTDISSHSDDGDLYSKELYLLNSDPLAISGASSSANLGDDYIEGKLRWMVNGNNTYLFPIGIQPSSLDAGTQPIQFTFSNNASSPYDILVYLEDGDVPLVFDKVYDDVGTNPNASGSSTLMDCTGGPDGVLDQIVLDRDQNHQWAIQASPSGSVEYTVTVMPSPSADVDALDIGPLGCQNVVLRYLAKEGVVGGDLSSNPIIGTTDFPQQPGFVLDPTGYSISGQTSLSSLRLHSTDPLSSTLPVELLSLEAYGNDNHIMVEWATATELNNSGFEILRSTDGENFENIAWLDGNGTSSDINIYAFKDYNFLPNIRYYYRLKQIDFNGEYEYSDIVSAILKAKDSNLSISLAPNPSLYESTLTIRSSEKGAAALKIFDALGKLVVNSQLWIQADIDQFLIQTKHLEEGVYFLSLEMQASTTNQKLFIK